MRMVGGYPERVENLYYLYLFMLRAFSKAKPHLEDFTCYTGHAREDVQCRKEMRQLLRSKLICSPNFDESAVFSEGVEDKAQVLAQIHAHLSNITKLMDCTSCAKCRLWGKVAMTGLSAAMKVVLEDLPFRGSGPPALQRTEIVAMVNFLKQLSESVGAVQRLLRLHRQQQNDPAKTDVTPQSAEQKPQSEEAGTESHHDDL
eukprot:RCo051952